PRPGEVARGVPADLENLAMRLLERAPDRRPTADEILAALAVRVPDGQTPSAALLVEEPLLPLRERARDPVRPPFVGREADLAVLREALRQSRQSLTTVRIVGPSGIGKTALVESFLDESGQGDAVVLRSACYPHETVPYRALDGMVDDLTRVLVSRRRDATEALPAGVAPLLRIFPVFGRLPGRPEAPDFYGRMEAHELRHRAFGALHEVLARLSARRTVIVWIDDFQWADLDSVAFLRTLLAAPDRARLLLLIAHRDDAPHEV